MGSVVIKLPVDFGQLETPVKRSEGLERSLVKLPNTAILFHLDPIGWLSPFSSSQTLSSNIHGANDHGLSSLLSVEVSVRLSIEGHTIGT